MPSRPGINISHDGQGQNVGASVQVFADSIQLACGGPGGPQCAETIDFSDVNGVSDINLKQLCDEINAICAGFGAQVHANSAGYNYATWLDIVGPLDVLDSSVDFNMTTAYLAKNPGVPAAGKVVTPTAFGDGNLVTGTRVDCPVNKALTTSGNFGDPAAPVQGTVDLDAEKAAAAAAQLLSDKAAVETGKADINDTRTILTVSGTQNLPAIVAAAQASGAAAQLAEDEAEVEAKKQHIRRGQTVLGVGGDLNVSRRTS